MSVQEDSGGVQLTLDEIPPQWAADDDPVIVAKRGCSTFHEPDLESEEPRPDCRYGGVDGDWKVRERRHAVGWKDQCDCCYGSER